MNFDRFLHLTIIQKTFHAKKVFVLTGEKRLLEKKSEG